MLSCGWPLKRFSIYSLLAGICCGCAQCVAVLLPLRVRLVALMCCDSRIWRLREVRVKRCSKYSGQPHNARQTGFPTDNVWRPRITLLRFFFYHATPQTHYEKGDLNTICIFVYIPADVGFLNKNGTKQHCNIG